MKTCIVVPHYDHFDQFEPFLPELVATGLPLIVVDDASPAAARAALQELLAASSADTTLVEHEENQGKGAAVITGLQAAHAAGFTHALQIDADGQHDSASIPDIVAAAEQDPDALVCGVPIFDESVFKFRYYARYITLFFARLESLSTSIKDAMCGFRVYPLAPINAMLDRVNFGRNMAFDCEILVRAIWADIPLRNVPVRVSYPEDGKSHFRYVRDNVDISWMHTRLLVGMVLRLPMLLARKLRPGRAAA